MASNAIFLKVKRYKPNRTHSIDRTRSNKRRSGGKRNKVLHNVKWPGAGQE